MIADLLRLATIGHNMELCAGHHLQQVHQQLGRAKQQQQQQASSRNEQNSNTSAANANAKQPNKRLPLEPQTQCKPLDLSVKRTQLARHANRLLQRAADLRLGHQLAAQLVRGQQHVTSSSPCSRSACCVSPVETNASNSTEVISSTNSSQAPLNSSTPTAPITQNPNRRHKHKGAKSHLCMQCGRSFSRSDMLTRHSRLHSGLKPYQCSKCKQVFSRSDHLSTHERTHTGEKPYQCQYCAYSACRRDMITRHMRTHASGTQRLRSPLRRRTTKEVANVNATSQENSDADEGDDISSSVEWTI